MKRILYVVMCAAVVMAKCPTKEKALQCFYDMADRNGDGRISEKELSHAIYSRLRWWEKAGFAIFGGTSRVMDDCDLNGDGYLTMEEALQMPDTCMDTCSKKKSTVNLFKCK